LAHGTSLLDSPTAELSGPSFAHVQNDDLRADKELLQQLHFLVAKYPRRARVLADAIEELEAEMTPRPPSPVDRVLAALEAGRATVEDIVGHTGLPTSTVYGLLHKRPLSDWVEIREGSRDEDPGRGGRRKAQKLYFLKHP
jgi:predicted Rossmann fold nucleotide-binding protein DprA/Smf involved in DNA uptake